MKLSPNKKLKALIAGLIALAILAIAAAPLVSASQPRDYDSNSIIYGGAYSISELNNKLNHGTGRQYQSSSQLKNLYNTLGIYQSDFDHLTNGTVFKDGRVTVNGKVVWRDAHSMGRQFMAGSTRDKRFPYPVYWRATHVSFAANSIPAYVYVNYDGTMAYAITKSCGNPVKGVGKKTPPVKTYTLEIKKYNDRNGNATRQMEEPFLANWTFTVKGPNTNKTVTTNKDGHVIVKGLTKGTYTVVENQKTGWTSTTGLKKTVKIVDRNQKILFGNKQNEKIEKFNVTAVKFEDVNGNALKDENEALLEGWSIRLTGNGITREFLTNGEGQVNYRDLPTGTYQVSEERRSGWRNITPLIQSITVNHDHPEGLVEFGNQRIPTEEIITTTSVPHLLPVTGPAEMIIGSIASIGLGSAGFVYRKSRKKLDDSFKKF